MYIRSIEEWDEEFGSKYQVNVFEYTNTYEIDGRFYGKIVKDDQVIIDAGHRDGLFNIVERRIDIDPRD